MAKHKKAAKNKVAARKKPAAKKKMALKSKAKAKARKAPLRKPVVRKTSRVEAKKEPKKLTPKQFAAKLKADQRDAKARDKAALKALKAEKAQQPAAPNDAKPKTRQRLTAKEKALVREFERKELSPLEAEARRSRLKNLIVLGKERGYLTYAEVNDHLPDDMLDAEQIENIISMINDMGIQVYDEAPDAETLLMNESTPAVVPDEDVVEEAEQALSTVDSEFGRTTDPVRMYMREMGSVELLTREGEIEIAKRIEDGLKHMIQAI